MAPPNRSGGGGLSLRTLAIASAASLTAALVTSRLFPAGTVYTAALTPVIVAAVSEMLNRPVNRVSEIRQRRRTVVIEQPEIRTARVQGEEGVPLAGPPEFVEGAATGELIGNGSGDHEPMTIHGRRRSRALHPKVWIATGLAAFAIAVAVLTLPELLFGGAAATSKNTTFFGGGGSPSSSTKTQTETSTTPTTTATTPTQTVTETVPTQTTPTSTETTPTTTDTATTTTPSGGTAPPPGTTTSTTTSIPTP